jgi:hypothetical protein
MINPSVPTLHVDLGRELGPAGRRAAGILYGLTEDGSNPPDEYLEGLGLRYVRAGGAQLDVSGGWVNGRYERRWAATLAQYRRTAAVGGTFIILVHDLYGADGSAINRWPGDGGEWSDFGTFLDRLLDDVGNAGMNPQWDLWNEPDIELFWDRPQEQFHEAWQIAFGKVRAAFPEAAIVGPSTATEPSEDNAWWNAYLDFIAADNVVPDIISWHEIGGTAHGQDPVASRAAVEEMLSSRGLTTRDFQVNEYAEDWQQNPGQSAWFISRLERADIDGLRANWASGQKLHDNLADLLTCTDRGYAPLGDWHTYQWYGGQQGMVVATESAGPLDVFATKADGSVPEAKLLLGNHGGWTGQVVLVVTGLEATGLGDPSVVINRIPNNDGQPVEGPNPVADVEIEKLGSDRIRITIQYVNDRDAFSFHLSPGHGLGARSLSTREQPRCGSHSPS